MRKLALFALLLLTSAAPAAAQQRYEDLPTSAGVGKWEPGAKPQSYKITVDGDAVYVNGVLQKVKFDPERDIAIRDGEAVLVPRGQGLTLRPRPAEKP